MELNRASVADRVMTTVRRLLVAARQVGSGIRVTDRIARWWVRTSRSMELSAVAANSSRESGGGSVVEVRGLAVSSRRAAIPVEAEGSH